ncbi:hypothetical protein [Winogradskyella maritima]|uniref:Uncharacterized protein n=1 Tax=Winogradskyella maritima TaxID=1517766 RepID=A0ABV8ADV3_9FLAO
MKTTKILVTLLIFTVSTSLFTQENTGYAVVSFTTNGALTCENGVINLVSQPVPISLDGNKNIIKFSLETQFLNWLYEYDRENFKLLKNSNANSRGVVFLGNTADDVMGKAKGYGLYSESTAYCKGKIRTITIENFESFDVTTSVYDHINSDKQDMLRKFIKYVPK